MGSYDDKKIIMIHGLASKPSKNDTHDLWSKALIENIRLEKNTVAEKIENTSGLLVSAYWANAIPNHIEDDDEYVDGLKIQVDKVIEERKRIEGEFHVGFGSKVKSFFQDRGLDLVDILSGALTVKDDVMKAFLRETELYSEDQYIADKIRKPLEDALIKAWDQNKEVVIISHSMGTFISYDVLWRFSHRSDARYLKHRNKKVKMFITMGSPLGNQVIKNMLFANYHKGHTIRHYPTNIDYWHNYSCLGDVVAHDAELTNDYLKKMQQLEIIKKNSRTARYAVDYTKLHNPFQVVSHKGNKGKNKSNPHKSYGYLVQPRLASWIIDFLEGTLK